MSLDRSIEELAFRAVCWATGTQVVRFSTGANELITADLEDRRDGETSPPHSTEEDTVNIVAPHEEDDGTVAVDNAPWELVGICRVDRDGESLYDTGHSGVVYREIDGAKGLDPPRTLPPDRPVSNLSTATLSTY